MTDLFIAPLGGRSVQIGGIAMSSPYLHEADPAAAGEPKLREFRGTLMQKNAAVGNTSPVCTIVTTS